MKKVDDFNLEAALANGCSLGMALESVIRQYREVSADPESDSMSIFISLSELLPRFFDEKRIEEICTSAKEVRSHLNEDFRESL